MAYPVGQPAGYVAPALFTVKTVVTGTAATQQAAINALQDNVLGIGYDLTQMVPALTVINSNVVSTYNNVLTVQSMITAQNIKFSNLSTQIGKISKGPTVLDSSLISQSFSFMLGAFVALAFVLASRMRY